MTPRHALCLALAVIFAFSALSAEAATTTHRHLVRHQIHQTHHQQAVRKR